jgi:phosphohistidine phosphatase
MKLILFRHGQAEELGTHANDAERELTAKGRDRLRRGADGLKFMLRDFSAIKIWSSPLIRACQTARIIADVLNIEKIEEFDALATGNMDAFQQKILTLPYGACLIAVGHDPYLGMWSKEICDVHLSFKKGAAAAIDVSSTNPLAGELCWFAQPQILSEFAR